MKFDLLGGSYQQKYKDFNSQRTVNWVPILATTQEKDKYDTSLFPTPGLDRFVSISGRYSRGLKVARTNSSNRCFHVVNNELYEIGTDHTATDLGTLTDITVGASPIFIEVNPTQIGFFHYSASYYMTLSTNVITKITDVQFPGLVDGTAYHDGYTFVISNGGVYYSDLNDMSSWDSLNTFTPSNNSSPAINIAVLMDELRIFTSNTIEFYFNDNGTFTRRPASTIDIGLVAKNSLAKYNDGLLFLGRGGENGEVAVYKQDKGYNLTIVSPPSINWLINSEGPNLDDCYGYIQYARDGRVLYYLTIPILETTFVYDLSTNLWHERSSLQPYEESDGTIPEREFRGKHFVSFQGLNLFSDIYSGNILLENYDTFTEDDTPIYRTRISQHFCDENKLIGINELEFDVNTGQGLSSGQGSNPLLTLEISNDVGYTYKPPRNVKLSPQGNYSFRTRVRGLGSHRTWVFKIRCTDPINIMIQSAFGHGSVGNY